MISDFWYPHPDPPVLQGCGIIKYYGGRGFQHLPRDLAFAIIA